MAVGTCKWCDKKRDNIPSETVQWFCSGIEGCGRFNPPIKPMKPWVCSNPDCIVRGLTLEIPEKCPKCGSDIAIEERTEV